MLKAAAIVFADTGSPEGLGRVMNALTTAQEFKDAGDDVLVVFDGAGTKWIAELSRENHKYHQLFEDVRDVVGGACSYCAEAFASRRRSKASASCCSRTTRATRACGRLSATAMR